MSVEEEAIQYVKDNKKELCRKFTSIEKFPPVDNPASYFMGGSPGAGKTEYSKSLIDLLHDLDPDRKIVRIDADEIRDWLPQYDRTNAIELQKAAALGVEKVLDFALEHKQDFILDATLAHYEKSYDNIRRSLKRKRKVAIIYIYQDPIVAWEFTKKREALEGRRVPKEMFINAFFLAKENANRIKKEFGNQIQLWLIIKNFEQGVEKTHFNIDNTDTYIEIKCTREELTDKLR